MLPLEVRIVPTYAIAANALLPFQAILDTLGITWLVEPVTGVRDRARMEPAQLLYRPDPAAGRHGDRHLPLPPVLHDHSGRAGRSLEDGRLGPARSSSGTCCCRSARTNMLALATIMFVSGLEPVSLAAADHHRPRPFRHRGDAAQGADPAHERHARLERHHGRRPHHHAAAAARRCLHAALVRARPHLHATSDRSRPMAAISHQGRQEALQQDRRRPRRRRRNRAGRVRRHPRAIGLRQVHAAAHDRRARGDHRRRRSRSAARWSTSSSRASAAAPWCSRTTRSIRT